MLSGFPVSQEKFFFSLPGVRFVVIVFSLAHVFAYFSLGVNCLIFFSFVVRFPLLIFSLSFNSFVQAASVINTLIAIPCYSMFYM